MTSRITNGVRAGIDTDPAQGAIVPPLYLSSTYSFAAFGECRQHEYSRTSNPTRDVLAEALANLEGGYAGTVTATGTAAMTLCLTALLRPGQAVLTPHDCYGGTWRLFDALAERGNFEFRTVDFTNADAVAGAFADPVPPTLVWLETPSNPLVRITDLAAVSAAAHEVGALVLADNTFLTPALQRPLEHGADLVLHSTTKYLNGHSDVVGGAVVASTPELHEELQAWANVLGVAGSPFDAYLTLRGMRTLFARMRAHQEGVAAVLDAVSGHPAIEQIYHPSLPSHPGHELAARQQDGFGSMFSIELRGGTEAVSAFLSGLRYMSLAESLGGTESLVAHPTTMTHAAMTPEARAAAGIRDGLLRFSLGIEDPADLVADIRAGLDRAVAAS